ncbi:MAG: hypothetical protein HYV07_20485 [Deltaproteobacteria bacterium]|nr:hypothetical protein [Deltaproteobacteria bacterium]
MSSRGGPSRILGVLLGAAMGCSSSDVILEAPSGSRILVAFADPSGHVRAVESGEGALTRVRTSEDGLAAVFVVSAESFLGVDGEPIDEATCDAAEALPGRAAVEPRSCGACLVPPLGGGPALVHSGDRCPVPVLPARVFEGELPTVDLLPSVLETLRVETQLSWPGECPARPTKTRSSEAHLVPCPLLPEGSPESFFTTTINTDGWIARMGENSAILSPPGRPPLRTPMDRIGPHRGLGPAHDGDGFVSVWTDYGIMVGSGSRWERMTESEGTLDVRPIQPPVDILASTFTSLGSRYFVGGEIRTRLGQFAPAVGVCELGSCRIAPVRTSADCSFGARGTRVVGFTEIPSGVIAMGTRGGILTSDGDEFVCRTDEHDLDSSLFLELEDGSRATWFEVKAVEVIGDRVFACGAIRAESGEVAGAVVTLDPSNWAHQTVVRSEKGRCGGLVHLFGATNLTAVFEGTAVELDRDARVVSEQPIGAGPGGLFGAIGRPVQSVRAAGAWAMLEADEGHTIYRAHPDRGLEAVMVTRSPLVSSIAAQVGPRELELLRVGQPSLRVEVGDDCASTTVRESGSALGAVGRPAGAATGAAGVRLIYGSDDRAAWVLIREPDGTERESWFEGFSGIVDAVELAPGRFVLAHRDNLSLLDIRGAPSIRSIEVEYDDPRTEDVERKAPGTQLPFLRLAGTPGVVWGGGDQTLVRVVAAPNGEARATGSWYSAYFQDALSGPLFGPPTVAAILAETPTHVDVAWNIPPNQPEDDRKAVVYRLVPVNDPCEGLVVLEDSLFRVCRLDESVSDFESSDELTGLARGPGGILFVGSSGRVLSLDSGRSVYAGHPARRSFDTAGSSLVLWDGMATVTALAER